MPLWRSFASSGSIAAANAGRSARAMGRSRFCALKPRRDDEKRSRQAPYVQERDSDPELVDRRVVEGDRDAGGFPCLPLGDRGARRLRAKRERQEERRNDALGNLLHDAIDLPPTL